MIVRQTQSQIEVTHCSTHFNHTIQLAHINIPELVRLKVASKLQQGVTINRILDDIRENVDKHSNLKREHFITRQDILNIQRQYNIQGIQRHSNDHCSIQAWVEELQAHDYNPVLIFKHQGEEQKHDMNNIGKNDFLLAIQTEFQKDMMRQFGNNTICIDATHGTNIYDFYLVSIMVVDDFGEGVPVLL